MAARTRRTSLNEKWRTRIKTSMIINRLQDHIEGKIEMSSQQVSAALGLLRKTAPDLSSVDHTGTIEHRDVSELSTAELIARIEDIQGTPAEKAIAREPDSVH